MNLTPVYQVGDTHGEFTFTKVLPIEELQVDLDEITEKLQVEGVDKFIVAFEDLLNEIDGKRAELEAA